MKKIFKGITIPYRYYDPSSAYELFIYKNKEYYDLGKLLNDFLGITLNYHYLINDKEYEVHNLSDVIYALCLHPEHFTIKNKKEYSKQEYDYIIKLQKSINDNKLKLEYIESELKFHSFKERKLYKIDKEFKKYRNIIIPKKIKSEANGLFYYTVGGEYYSSLFAALDNVYNNSLYYPYGGSKRPNDRTHRHVHSFEELIEDVFEDNKFFKIHPFQSEYYSKQEIEILIELANQLTTKGYRSIPNPYEQLDYEEYRYLKDNHKYISLLIFNIKWNIKEKQYKKDVIKSHKI